MRVSVFIGHANLISTCPKCEEPMTGEMDSDYSEFTLACVGCGHDEKFRREDWDWTIWSKDISTTRSEEKGGK